MEYNNFHKLFFRFLKDNDAYKSYLKNRKIYITKYKCKGELTCNERDLISYAFNWDETAQGMNYWLNLSRKWNRILKEL